MSELQLTLRFRVHGGERERFEAIARECMQRTRDLDSGTLQYDWFHDEGGTEYVVRERYRDSGAVLEHAVHLGDLIGAITQVADAEVEIFGSPTAELLGAIAAMAPRVYAPLQSL